MTLGNSVQGACGNEPRADTTSVAVPLDDWAIMKELVQTAPATTGDRATWNGRRNPQ
jgi:hypothetical protein